MGFLSKEAELKEVQVRDIRAEAERDRLAREARAAAQKLFDEDKAHAPEDNRSIIALLDNLPDFDLGRYLAIVARHTQYEIDVVLYTRLALFDPNEQLRLLEQDRELMDKLNGKGISPVRYDDAYGYCKPATITPKVMFCGVDNLKKGLFRLTPIAEPQVPGIGIKFSKWAGVRQTSAYTYVSYDAVFARFVTPAIVVVNGSRERLTVTSLEVFDNVLERAFKNPCRYIDQIVEKQFIGGLTG